MSVEKRRRTAPDPKIETLRSLGLFQDCTGAQLGLVARLADLTTVPVDTEVMTEGGSATQSLVIVDGRAVVTRGQEVIATLGPGEVVGEVAVVRSCRRGATVTTATPLTVLAFDPRSFRELLRSLPAVHGRVVAALERRCAGSPVAADIAT